MVKKNVKHIVLEPQNIDKLKLCQYGFRIKPLLFRFELFSKYELATDKVVKRWIKWI